TPFPKLKASPSPLWSPQMSLPNSNPRVHLTTWFSAMGRRGKKACGFGWKQSVSLRSAGLVNGAGSLQDDDTEPPACAGCHDGVQSAFWRPPTRRQRHRAVSLKQDAKTKLPQTNTVLDRN